jgi:DNA-binding MarR family transcriptional regulator
VATSPVPSYLDDRITRFGMLAEGFGRLHRELERSLRSDSGLSMAWFEVMLRLGRSPNHELMMSELADQLAITSGGVTRLVDRLVEAGYVERKACPEDRRVHWARLTDVGRVKLDAATRTHLDELQSEYFDRLSSDELDTITAVMDRLRRAGSVEEPVR